MFKKISKSSNKGQAIPEFALVIPVFILFLFVIFEGGWFFFNKFEVANAVYDASRYYSIIEDEGYTDAEITESLTSMILDDLLLVNDDNVEIEFGAVDVREVYMNVTVTIPTLTKFFRPSYTMNEYVKIHVY